MIHHYSDLFYDIVQQMNTIKDKLAPFHWCFKPNLISKKKWFKRSSITYNFICFSINHDVYAITLWIHYTLFINVFSKNKVSCYCQLNFSRIKIFKIIYDVSQIWSNFIKIFFNWQCFISISVTFLFNIICAPKITYSYWLMIIFFFLLKKFPNLPNYSVFDCCIFLFQSEKISFIFNYFVIYFFFSLRRAAKVPRFYKVLAAFLNILINPFFIINIFIIFFDIYKNV